MIKLGIFDWNGTCINDLPLAFKSIVEIFRENSLPPPTIEEYRNEIESDFIKFYRAHGIPEASSPEALNKIRARCMERAWYEAELMPGLWDTIRALKSRGIMTAIVSAEIGDMLKKNLIRFGTTEYFDYFKGDAWPKGEALVEALRKFNVRPSEAFYIGDTADDVEISKALGLVSLGFTGGYNSRERIAAAKPDFVIDNLLEIIQIVNTING